MAGTFDGYGLAGACDEMFEAPGQPQPPYVGLITVPQPMDLPKLRFRAHSWSGRYVERADDTARLVDAYVHRMLSDPALQVSGSAGDSRTLFGILSIEPSNGERPDVGAALFRLAYHLQNPSASAGAIVAARSGADGSGQVISSEIWECLHVTAHGVGAQRRSAQRLGPHVFLRLAWPTRP